MMMSTKALVPTTMEALDKALSEMTPASKVIGGGTDLIIQLRNRHLSPDALLYLGELPECKKMEDLGDRVYIGAAARVADIADNPLFGDGLRALADAALTMGSVQIRNLATIGGNVASASPAGDFPPVLFLLDATAVIASPGGGLRHVPIDQVVVGANRNSLSYNDVLVGFHVPKLSAGQYSAFVKLGFRQSVSIARINLAARVAFDANEVVEAVKLVIGAVSSVPSRIVEAEKYMIGKKLADSAKGVSKILSEFILPIAKTRTRSGLYKVGAVYGVVEDLFTRLDCEA